MVGTPAAEHVKEKVELQDDREGGVAISTSDGVEGLEEPERLMNSHAWLFEGAEPGRLPALLAEMQADSEDEDDDDGEEAGHDEKDEQGGGETAISPNAA